MGSVLVHSAPSSFGILFAYILKEYTMVPTALLNCVYILERCGGYTCKKLTETTPPLLCVCIRIQVDCNK